jgi:putative nonproteinogenic amino acid hydroxylase
VLKSRRLAVLPIDEYRIDSELTTIDLQEVQDEYDAFTFGSWSAYVLANSSGDDRDTAFRPHSGDLVTTELGRQLQGIMSIVTNHFDTEYLQWVRIFSLRDGLLAPHVDFLEFSEPGTRLQVPLRTTGESLHSENDIVYQLRRGEVWEIHTTDPHSARSPAGPARLSLCLDFAHTGKSVNIKNDIPATTDIRIVPRPPLADSELAALVECGAEMGAGNIRDYFRRFASVHFERQAHATAAFDWFTAAAQRSGDEDLVHKAQAFRTFCIGKRSYREHFSW